MSVKFIIFGLIILKKIVIMKKTLLLILTITTSFLSAQDCSQLFFSEYVEGWSNNKALEIYNPTGDAIDLSAYSVSRYSNGGTTPSTTQLEGTIEPFDVFVLCLDKQDPNGTGYEAPVWDGYFTYTDSLTGEEVTIYDENDDLQGKVDLFLNPIYYFGTDADSAAAFPTTMYFNGNDAVTLELLGTGIVLDLIGKVGEDPGASWTDTDGNYWTKDHTLIRKAWVSQGISMNPTIFDPTLEWDSLSVNTFMNLGFHDCDCNGNSNLEELNTTLKVYPNPAQNDYVYIQSSLPIKKYTLYNSIGKVILQENISDLKDFKLSAENLKSGIYFITIENNFGRETKSILIE